MEELLLFEFLLRFILFRIKIFLMTFALRNLIRVAVGSTHIQFTCTKYDSEHAFMDEMNGDQIRDTLRISSFAW